MHRYASACVCTEYIDILHPIGTYSSSWVCVLYLQPPTPPSQTVNFDGFGVGHNIVGSVGVLLQDTTTTGGRQWDLLYL